MTDADYSDQAAEFIAEAQRYAALGLPVLPDDPAAAAAMRAAGYEVLAEVLEVGDVAIVHVLSEDEYVRHVVSPGSLTAALGIPAAELPGREFIATLRETPETGPVLSGFRPVVGGNVGAFR
jgi:hypothetical protein